MRRKDRGARRRRRGRRDVEAVWQRLHLVGQLLLLAPEGQLPLLHGREPREHHAHLLRVGRLRLCLLAHELVDLRDALPQGALARRGGGVGALPHDLLLLDLLEPRLDLRLLRAHRLHVVAEGFHAPAECLILEALLMKDLLLEPHKPCVDLAIRVHPRSTARVGVH